MLFCVFTTITAFVANVRGVDVIGLADLPVVGGSILVLLALSSHRARDYAARGRHLAKEVSAETSASIAPSRGRTDRRLPKYCGLRPDFRSAAPLAALPEERSRVDELQSFLGRTSGAGRPGPSAKEHDMDSSVSRRTLLTGTAAGFGFAFAGSMEAFARPAPGSRAGSPGTGRSSRSGRGAEPPGRFQLRGGRPIGRHHDRRRRAYPSDPDGMGVFAGAAGGSILITNHEISVDEPTPVPAIAGLTYDPEAIGGTSTVTVDEIGNLRSTYTSLAGTDNNCAGGVTPWGTWLTCEETERKKGTVIGTEPRGGP